MCQRLLTDAKLPGLLLKFDSELANEAQTAGCSRCGGRLDSANYPRKPRGATLALPEEYSSRFSFCCAARGCRRRRTPPSVRFLGRRVYLGAVVVLATAMQQGVTPIRAQRLKELLGVSLRTLARWREWWLTAFAESDFWKAERARFMPPVGEGGLPQSVLERFGDGSEAGRLLSLLRWLAPLTTSAGYVPDQRF